MLLSHAKLKNAFKLSCRINAYIPSTIHNIPIDNNEYILRIAELFSKLFGGATSTDALGFWMSEAVGMIKEKTTIVFAYCTTEQLNKSLDEVITALEDLKIELKQEAIALEINGKMYFI